MLVWKASLPVVKSVTKRLQKSSSGGEAVSRPSPDDLAPLERPWGLDAQATVLSYPGPALLVSSRLETLSLNREGEVLHHLLALEDEVPAGEKLRSAVREAIVLNMPTETRVDVIDVSADPLKRSFDVSILPCQSAAETGNSVLVLGRETTLENSITDALVHSRELFQDLVKCSSDFAWETDSDGAFQFVSVRGTSAFSADKLNGTPATNLIDWERSKLAVGVSPFSAQFPIEDVEVWLKAPGGDLRCMLMTVVPLISDDGKHLGARGACVDVTELRRNELLLKAARRREELVDRIVETIRSKFDPGAMMRTAALEIGDVLEADFGCVLMAEQANSSFHIGGSTGPADGAEEALASDIVHDVLASDLVKKDGALRVIQREYEGHLILICGTVFAGKVNGALVLWRFEHQDPWTEEDRVLLYHIASHMGIALAQAAHAEALETLSRVDGMTGLLNRRAFFDDAEGCFARNSRTGHPIAYVYLDLDNFKTINDTLGHGVGDQLLVAFSDTLKALVRRGDLAVRLGGDEFGLLLDDCEERDATNKAELIVRKLREIAEKMGLPSSLSVSAGIAIWSPDSKETISQVMDRADKVLYDAKRAGKGAWRVA